MTTEKDTAAHSSDPTGSPGPENESAAKSADTPTAPAASSKPASAATERPRKKIRVKTGKRKSKTRVWKTRWVRAQKPAVKQETK